MKHQSTDASMQDDLFRHRLDNVISLQHPLVRLSERIDWDRLNGLLGDYYEDAVVGQPPKPTRLMAGLLYLKHAFGLSDEDGHTLTWSLAHTKLNIRVRIKTAVLDKGYRDHKTGWPGVEMVIPG